MNILFYEEDETAAYTHSVLRYMLKDKHVFITLKTGEVVEGTVQQVYPVSGDARVGITLLGSNGLPGVVYVGDFDGIDIYTRPEPSDRSE